MGTMGDSIRIALAVNRPACQRQEEKIDCSTLWFVAASLLFPHETPPRPASHIPFLSIGSFRHPFPSLQLSRHMSPSDSYLLGKMGRQVERRSHLGWKNGNSRNGSPRYGC